MKEKDRVHNALIAVAAINGMTVDEVRTEIQAAIDEAMKSTDPSVQQFWASIPHKGPAPTPEEVIDCISSRFTADCDYIQ